jgi:hypothetical protein
MAQLSDKISNLELFTASFAAYRINDSKIVRSIHKGNISSAQANYRIMMDLVRGTRTDITDADREIALQCLEHFRNKIVNLIAERVPFQTRQLITAANTETIEQSVVPLSVFVQLPLIYKQDLDYQNMQDKMRWASGDYIAQIGQSVHFSGTVLMCRFNSTWGTFSITVLTDRDQVIKFSLPNLPREFNTRITEARITGTGMVSKHYENGISKLNRIRYQLTRVLTNTEDNTTM